MHWCEREIDVRPRRNPRVMTLGDVLPWSLGLGLGIAAVYELGRWLL